MRILFVCSGNLCRSPMAEAYMRQRLAMDGRHGAHVIESAGTLGLEGDPADSVAIATVERDSGADLRPHRSRGLRRDIIEDADLVLVMERGHLSAVQALGADPKRTFVLSEYPEPGEPTLPLSDPFGGSLESYEECWRRIRRHVRRAAPHIVEASRARSV